MDMTVSSKVATGTRVPWWRGMLGSVGWVIWLVVSVFGLFYAAKQLAFHREWLDSGDYMFYGAIVLVAAVGFFIARAERNSGERFVHCECPACGAPVQLSFTPSQLIDRCRKCGVYCRANDLAIEEVPLETLLPERFFVESDRYVDVVRRDNGSRVYFEMPAFCAVCGSPEASRTVSIQVPSSTGSGTSEGFIGQEINYALTGKHHVRSSRDPSRVTGNDLKLIEVPVCAQHAEPASPPLSSDDWGKLGFVSYRYYKAFCVANKLRTPSQ